MNGRVGMTGDGVVRGDAAFGKAMTKKQRDNAAGAAVGTGTVLAAGGLVGGGVPGARPDSGRLRHIATNTKGKAAATRHIVSATRGGIFGYREDAHRAFLNAKNKDLRGWRAPEHDTGNHFERGVAQGKVQPEKKIIRTMARARTGSNIALGGGAALVAGGALVHHGNKKRELAKRSDYKENALLAGGGTTAVAGFGGAKVLEHQGRKWANKTSGHLQQARQINPNLGRHRWETTRQRKLLGAKTANVPDVRAHRSTNDIIGDAWHSQAGQTKEQAVAAGKHRGAATQSRYFARVYGSQARVARKVGAAGALVALTGAAGKKYEIKRRPVSKAVTDLRQGHIPGVAARVDENGKIHSTIRPQRKSPVGHARRYPPVKEAKPQLVKVVSAGHGRKALLVATGAGAAGGFAAGRVTKSDGAFNRATRRAHANLSEEQRTREVQTRLARRGKGASRAQFEQTAANLRAEHEALKAKAAAPPAPAVRRMSGRRKALLVGTGVAAVGAGGYALHRRRQVAKVDTTMSEAQAHKLARQYDTKGPLPKGLDRETKMKAYEARYVAAGGKKAEKWKRRADAGEVQRNVGLAVATGLGAGSLIARHPRIMAKAPHAHKKLEVGSLAGAVHGGAAELYSEHARSRRASYQNSPAGIAGSALTRMRAYTPETRKP